MNNLATIEALRKYRNGLLLSSCLYYNTAAEEACSSDSSRPVNVLGQLLGKGRRESELPSQVDAGMGTHDDSPIYFLLVEGRDWRRG